MSHGKGNDSSTTQEQANSDTGEIEMTLANHYNCLLTAFFALALWPNPPLLVERALGAVLSSARSCAASENYLLVVVWQ